MRNFPTPRSVEDALSRKRRLVEDITRLQSALTDRRSRAESKRKLEEAVAETRFLKDWLRLNASHKPSEYEMLGRAYRLISELEERGAPVGEDADALLSDIEMHVPHAFLFRDRERGAA